MVQILIRATLLLFQIQSFVLDSALYEEGEDEILVTGTSVELALVIWQNIMLEKPLRVVKEGAHEQLKKQRIEFETEEELHESESEPKVDPISGFIKIAK